VSAQVRGLDQSVVADPGFKKFIQIDSGSIFPEKQNEAVLGRYLARALGVGVGDTVTLITLSDAYEGQMLPKLNIFRVAGIVSSGYRELDANWFIVQSDTALRLLNPSTAHAFIGVKTADPYGPTLNGIASEVHDQLVQSGLSDIPGFNIRTWRDIERSLFASFSSTKSTLILIMRSPSSSLQSISARPSPLMSSSTGQRLPSSEHVEFLHNRRHRFFY